MRELSELEQAKIESLVVGIGEDARNGMTAMLQCLDRPLDEDDVIHTTGSVLFFGVTKAALVPDDYTFCDLAPKPDK